MGGGKETPRQKMVGLMYLVLMALLAMNVSKEIINAFVTLNNKIEKSIKQTEDYNRNINEVFDVSIATLKSTGAAPKEIARVEAHKKTNDEIINLTRDMCNDLVKRNLYLLISAADASTTFEDFDDIEYANMNEAVLKNSGKDESAKSSGQSKIKALADKVNSLGLVVHEDHGEGGHHEEEGEYHNNLFDVDELGYIHIKDLSGYSKKDDYDTPTRLLAGESFEMIAPEGLHMMENLIKYRNNLISLIANHDYIDKKTGETKTYKFDTSMIADPEFLITEQDENSFTSLVDSVMNIQVKEGKIGPEDKDVIRDIFVRMTIPQKVMNHGEEYPWIFGQFDHAPIVAASAVMTSVRSDVLQVQTLASQLIASRVKVQSFNFNKIDPLAFSSTSYINQGDSLGLKVMIAAYDSTEAMELKYWIDDTTKTSEAIEFTGKAGQEVRLSGGVGDHVLVGEIAVEEKGVKKWKPWKFNYSVGAPNAAVSAADLQVLYMGWKNKIKVSASGYNPEKVKVSCKGCSITSKPDKDGNYIATVSNPRLKQVQIIVTGQDDTGKNNELTNETFRVFPLPDPTPEFGNQTGGKMSKANAARFNVVKAKLGNSPLNVNFDVKGFVVSVVKGGRPIEETSRSNRLTPAQKKLIAGAPKGGQLTFSNIIVKGPSGSPYELKGGIIIKLN